MQETENKRQEMIDLGNLVPNKFNTYEIVDIDDLKESILTYGLLTPLSVIGPTEDGKYSILSGERRYTALSSLKAAGHDEFSSVPCWILNTAEMDEYMQQLIIETSNLETREGIDVNAHRFNIVKILKKMSDLGLIEHHKIVDNLTKYMKGSPRYSRMYLQIFESENQTIIDLVNETDKSKPSLTVTEAAKALRLEEDKQAEVIDAILNGADKKEVLDAAIKEHQNKKKKDFLDSQPEFDPSLEHYTEASGFGAFDGFESVISSPSEKSYSDYDGFDMDDLENMSIDDLNKLADETRKEDYIDNCPANLKKVDDTSDNILTRINRWCKGMMNKQTYTAEECETIELLKEMLDVVDSKLN